MKRVRRVLRMFVINALAGLYPLPRPVRVALYRACGIEVGQRTTIFPGQIIRPGPLAIGDDVFINGQCVFDPGEAGISLGADVFLGARVVLTAETHEIGPASRRAARPRSLPIAIGAGSWLGAGVTVLPGVTVAPGCVIGAGAVVTADTEPNGVYTGVPARRVRDLPDGPGRG